MRSNVARIGLETLENRALLTTTVGLDDGTTQVVGDQVGTVDVTLYVSSNNSDRAPATVTLTTGGGTAVPGVDYTPVQKTLTLTPVDPTSPGGFSNLTQVAIPILPGPASLGTRMFQVSVSPSPGAPDGQSESIVITHGADTTLPYVTDAQALTQGGKVIAFSLQFSKPMAIGPVSDVANYVADAPKSAAEFTGAVATGGTNLPYTKNIPLKSATYDAATDTVYLVPVKPVKVSHRATHSTIAFRVGSTPSTSFSSLTDTSGNPIEGDNPGSFGQAVEVVQASPSIVSSLFGTATNASPGGRAKVIHRAK